MKALARVLRALAALSLTLSTSTAWGQDWSADGNIAAQRVERYLQLIEREAGESYALKQVLQRVGQGAEYERLLKTYEDKVAKDPNQFNLRMVLGHMYRHGKRNAQALAAYRSAEKIQKNALLYQSIAAIEAENRNYAEAIEAYREALKLSKRPQEKIDMLKALTQLALERRKLDEAKRYTEELLALPVKELFLIQELAQSYSQYQLYPEARALLDKASQQTGLSAADRLQISYERAKLYELEGKETEALALYRELEEKAKNSAAWLARDISLRIIDLYRRQGKIEELLTELKKTWKNPNYAQNLELAALYEENLQNAKALEHYQAALKQRSAEPETHLALIGFYRRQGRIDEAIKAREQLTKTLRNQPQFRFDLYQDYLNQKKVKEALAVLDTMTKDFAGNSDVQMRLAEYYMYHSKNQKAEAIYINWLKRNPNDIEFIEALGNYYALDNKKAEALKTWKRIEKIPMDASTKLETMARIYEDAGLHQEAEKLYLEAKKNHKDCNALRNYAEILTRNNKRSQAIEAWEALVESCPQRPILRLAAQQSAQLHQDAGSGYLVLKQKLHGKVVEDFTFEALLYLADFALALGFPQEVLPLLEAYSAKAPEQEQVLEALHQLYASSPDKEAAKEALQKQVASFKGRARYSALLALAQVHQELGELELERERLKEALEIDERELEAHERLATVYLKLRQYEQAAHYFQRALSLQPHDGNLAFKTASVLTILGQEREASEIYLKLVLESRDERLVDAAARRLIEDYSWRKELDQLEQALMPLRRSQAMPEVYNHIWLRLAQAQAQPYWMALRNLRPQDTLSEQHALKELAKRYAGVLSTALLSEDIGIQAQAIELSQYLSSDGMIAALSYRIDNLAQSALGFELQVKAVQALVLAQTASAVPTLKAFLGPRYSKIIQDLALWGLALLPGEASKAVLLENTQASTTSKLELAYFGLGLQGHELPILREYLRKEANINHSISHIAAWFLAFHREDEAKDLVLKLYQGRALEPAQLWAWLQYLEDIQENQVWLHVWLSPENTRELALSWLHRGRQRRDLLNLLTRERKVQIQDRGQSRLSLEPSLLELLERLSFATLERKKDSQALGPEALAQLFEQAKILAQEKLNWTEFKTLKREAQSQMMQDLLYPEQKLGIIEDQKFRQARQNFAKEILPQLKHWRTHDRSLKAFAQSLAVLSGDAESMRTSIRDAEVAEQIEDRLQAIEALAWSEQGEARQVLQKLASHEDSLIRATAISKLDPRRADERALLEVAQNDAQRMVRDLATAQLKQ